MIDYRGIAEKIFIKRLITEVYPTGIVSAVADSFDFWRVITEIAPSLKDDILARKPDALGNAKVVFRPDSGDPVKIVAGLRFVEISNPSSYEDVLKAFDTDADVVKYEGKYFDYAEVKERLILVEEIPEHVVKGAVECLYDIFGGDTTDVDVSGHGDVVKYKTLNQRVGLIYGDSITLERQQQILQRLMDKGFSAGNIVFGVGSYAYQYNTRDSLGMAVKATYGVVNGEGRELFKDPATDSGVKKSAKGLLRVEKEGNNFVLYDQQTQAQEQLGELQTVFIDGYVDNITTLGEIRQRVKQS